MCVENTSNLGGGSCYDQTTLDDIAKVAASLGCATHIDGARIFNAAIATGVDVARMCQHYDSVSICFSKGLGAPVGSVLVGRQPSSPRPIGGANCSVEVGGKRACWHRLAFMRLTTTLSDCKTIMNVPSALLSCSTNFRIHRRPFHRADQHGLRQHDPSCGRGGRAVRANGVDMFDLSDNRIRVVVHLHITDEDVERFTDISQRLFG